MAVGFVDLSNPENAKYASINGNYYDVCGPVAKSAVLLSSHRSLRREKLKETLGNKEDMRSMISKVQQTKQYQNVGSLLGYR